MDKKRLLFTITKAYVDKYKLNDSFIGKKICIYSDRYDHIEKHRYQFSNPNELTFIIENLDNIVSNPDFVHINNANKGMEIVKRLKDNVLVVVRISKSSELKIRSLYPINNQKYKRLKND